MAVVYCGVNHNEFWDLSWYELNLYLFREQERKRTERELQEAEWDRTSVIWSTIINMSGKVSRKKIKPEELFDKKKKKEKVKLLTPNEVDEIFKKNGK